MTDTDILDIAIDTMFVALKLSAPILLTAPVLGFAISLSRRCPQPQELPPPLRASPPPARPAAPPGPRVRRPAVPGDDADPGVHPRLRPQGRRRRRRAHRLG